MGVGFFNYKQTCNSLSTNLSIRLLYLNSFTIKDKVVYLLCGYNKTTNMK